MHLSEYRQVYNYTCLENHQETGYYNIILSLNSPVKLYSEQMTRAVGQPQGGSVGLLKEILLHNQLFHSSKSINLVDREFAVTLMKNKLLYI